MSDESAGRLQEIQKELAAILEERLSELTEAMRAAEVTTRRMVGAEVEIERCRQTSARLQSEMADLESGVEEARHRAGQARDRHAALLAERARVQQEVAGVEQEVRHAEHEVEQTRGRVESLQAEANELNSENNSLMTKLKTLEENIARMRTLKEELMHSISGLTQQMTGLVGGGSE